MSVKFNTDLLFLDLVTNLARVIEEDESPVVVLATQIMLVIQNIRNVAKHVEMDIGAKREELEQMIASLHKTDYCRTNLPARIHHAIDSTTTDGALPKLYAVTPYHLALIQNFTIRFFGKFKYADAAIYGTTYQPKLTIGQESFDPTESTHHAITFKPTLQSAVKPLTTTLQVSLTVPYEVGNFGWVVANIQSFQYNIPMRLLPASPGKIVVTYKNPHSEINTIEIPIAWGESKSFGNSRVELLKLSYTSFDGHTFELTQPGKVSYLELSKNETCWQITSLPPDGL